MGADEVAAIRPMIQEVYEALEAGEAEHFAHFEHSDNPDQWVEVAPGVVSFCYPFQDPPTQRLERAGVPLIEEAVLSSWQPGVHASLEHGPTKIGTIARFVDSVFETVLGCGTEYPLDCTLGKTLKR